MSKIKKRYCWNCGNEVPYIEYKQMISIPKCINCGVLYPEKKKLEAELTLKQEQYLATRSDKDMNEFFKDIPQLTFNLICKVLKREQKKLDPELIWDKANWAVSILVRYYKNKPDFKISGSFCGYISQMILYPLFNKKDKDKEEREVSLSTPIKSESESNSKKSLEDFISLNTMNFDYSSDVEEELIKSEMQKEIPNKIIDFVKNFIKICYEEKKISIIEMYELFVLFNLFCKKKNISYFQEIFKTSTPKIQDIWNEMLNLLNEKLQESKYE